MRFGVIGEPCIDYIHRSGVPSEKRLGGILYSIVSLAVISKAEDEIIPVINLGEDEFDFVTGFLGKFPNINTEYVNKSGLNTRVVNLYYENNTIRGGDSASQKTYDREENSTMPTLPVKFEEIETILSSLDGLLVNLVSGVDISLETLKKIRASFGRYIHMDLHNLVMKTGGDGSRTQVPVQNWLEWCGISDTLQMNESEISVMPSEKMNEYETAYKILDCQCVKALIITRGKLGVSLYKKTKKEYQGKMHIELDKIDLPALEPAHFVDSTGCGDVFGSAFFHRCVINGFAENELHSNLNYANKIASRNAALFGVEELYKLD